MDTRPIERVDADLLACSCSPAVVSRGAMLGERTPLTVDLENGFGDVPEACADIVRAVSALGVIGGSIEDATGCAEDPICPFDLVVTRVLPFPFMLTARAENLLWGRIDIDDTVRRLQAFAEVGADVLYAPGLKTAEEVEHVVQAVASKPVNVVMGLSGSTLDCATLSGLGLRRISLGSSFARAAYGEMLRAAGEVLQAGRFDFARCASGLASLNAAFIAGGSMVSQPAANRAGGAPESTACTNRWLPRGHQ